MSWTYNGSPFTVPYTAQSLVDSVRFLVGDTLTADPQLQDGEITGLLTQNSSSPVSVGFPISGVTYDPYAAAVAACTALSATYTRKANRSVGDLSISSGAIAKAYRDMIPGIRRLAMRQNAILPYAGGISLGDMENDEGNDDINQPNFSIGMDDNQDNSPSVSGGATGFNQAVPSG